VSAPPVPRISREPNSRPAMISGSSAICVSLPALR
jgi:hypothetical protein